MNLKNREQTALLVFFLLVKCGYSNKSPLRILGGRDSETSEYPYIVRLERQVIEFINSTQVAKNDHHCTCSALTPIWTLTAAHCVDSIEIFLKNQGTNKDVDAKAVLRYGSVLDTPLNNSNSFSNVVALITHPRYTQIEFIDGLHSFNDIGLLRNDPILIKQYGKISAVDYASLIGQKVLIVGFGLTNNTGKDGKREIQSTLRLHRPLQVSSVIIKKCERYVLARFYPVLCTAKPCGQHVTICKGDSGGPVLHAAKIIAVNTVGPTGACKKTDAKSTPTAGYMTPVSPYFDWIVNELSTNREYTGLQN